jgi:hypothetical protein
VNTDDLIDSEEDQTLCEGGFPLSSDTEGLDNKKHLTTLTSSVRSFNSTLYDINRGSEDPIVQDMERAEEHSKLYLQPQPQWKPRRNSLRLHTLSLTKPRKTKLEVL